MRQRVADQRGQAVVELALAMSVLMLLALGAIQFGVLFNLKLKVEHAAREGARFASIHALAEGSDAAIRQHTAASAPDLAPPIAPEQVSVEPTEDDGRAGNTPVRVRVEYPYTPDVPMIRLLLPQTLVIRGQTAMRIEG